MKLPKKISVLGQEYKIKQVKGLMEKENIEGSCSSHEYLISVDASLKGLVLRRVLYHEIGHAYCYESGLHEIMSHQALEMFCQTFSGLIESLKGVI